MDGLNVCPAHMCAKGCVWRVGEGGFCNTFAAVVYCYSGEICLLVFLFFCLWRAARILAYPATASGAALIGALSMVRLRCFFLAGFSSSIHSGTEQPDALMTLAILRTIVVV